MHTHATTEPTLRGWLATRSASERATLARLWALPEPLRDAPEPDALADALLSPPNVDRVLAALDQRERAALDRLLRDEDAALSAAVLEREFGGVRAAEHYPNPRAYLLSLAQPPSPTERLYTLGLALVSERGHERRYFVPPDMRELLPPVPPHDTSLHLAPAAAPRRIVEGDAAEFEYTLVTLLVLAQAGLLTLTPNGTLTKAAMVQLAKRWGQKRDDLRGAIHERHWPYVRFLRTVAQGAGLVRAASTGELRPTSAAHEWLAAPPVERARRLLDGWAQSEWDELSDALGMKLTRYAFGRDLPAARRAILAMLRQAPVGAWVTWDNLLHEVQRATPDFARSNGRYDTWGIVSYRGEHLDGYDRWPDVEGEQLRASIAGSLRWLGLSDYGGDEGEDDEEARPVSFRINALGAAALGMAPEPELTPPAPIVVQGTYEVLVPRHAAPLARFEVARVAAYRAGGEVEHYQLTRASVQAAVAADIDIAAAARALEQASGAELPQNVAYSLREWAGQYGNLSIGPAALLRAEDPLLLEQVRRDKRIRMPKHEQLAPGVVSLSEGDAAKLAEELRRVGYGLAGEVQAANGSPLKPGDLTILYAALEFYASACAELGVDGEASGALRQRVGRLLDVRQRERAARVQYEALRALRGGLEGRGPSKK
jgi:hypothetical protein